MDSEPLAALAHLSVGIVGVWLAIIDAAEHRLPNVGTGILALLVGTLGVLGASGEGLINGLVCAGVSAGLMAVLAWAPPGALGWGDVKLQVGLGLYLGLFSPALVVVQVAGSFVIGGAVALGALATRSLGPQDSLAFGPSMVSATIVTYFLGKSAEII